MAIALAVFVLGSTTYAYSIKTEDKSPFLRIGQVFATAARNWHTMPSAINVEQEAQGILSDHGSQQLSFLNKALVSPDGSGKDGSVCTVTDVEEAKAVVRLFPIWATCLVYAIVIAHSSTLFTKQGVAMDRSIGSSFAVPAASLQSSITFFIVLFIPFYARILVPAARSLTGKPTGISMLQRIGTGIFIPMISMIIVALVESKRLEVALQHGLIDLPHATVPMSVWWLVPQYALFGVADAFTMVGLQEFFYDQVPSELRSVGLSLYLSIFGIGSLLSSFMISAINEAARVNGRDGWFVDNLNRAHLDYFYWLLGGLSAVGLGLFLFFAKSYAYLIFCKYYNNTQGGLSATNHQCHGYSQPPVHVQLTIFSIKFLNSSSFSLDMISEPRTTRPVQACLLYMFAFSLTQLNLEAANYLSGGQIASSYALPSTNVFGNHHTNSPCIIIDWSVLDQPQPGSFY
ncbi:hypothetical protein Ancab_038171 [Ancistrocladus abbreviatus]